MTKADGTQSLARCRACSRNDQAVSVPAAVRDGRVITTSREATIGPYGTLQTRTRTLHVGALAVALRAPRKPRTTLSPTVSLAVSGILAAGCLQIAATAQSGLAVAGAVFWLAVAIASGARLRTGFRRNPNASMLASRALYLWRRSWYCQRCGVATVITPAGSTMLPADPLAPHLLDLAAQLRWRAMQEE